MDRKAEINYMNKTAIGAKLSLALIAVFLFSCLAIGCSKEKTKIAKLGLSLDSSYSMHTHDVNTLISDSGLVQFRLISPDWYIYERSEPKRWYFPNGIYIERFDTLYNPTATVKADTAYFMTEQDLWILIGNVHVRDMEGKNFFSPKLYWDQQAESIYSHDTIYVLTPDQIHRGASFQASQDLRKYNVYDHSGEIEVNEDGQFVGNEGQKPDSISTNQKPEAESVSNSTNNEEKSKAIRRNANIKQPLSHS